MVEAGSGEGTPEVGVREAVGGGDGGQHARQVDNADHHQRQGFGHHLDAGIDGAGAVERNAKHGAQIKRLDRRRQGHEDHGDGGDENFAGYNSYEYVISRMRDAATPTADARTFNTS